MNSLVKIVFFALLARVMGLTNVEIEGSTYESYGLVGFGKIPSDAVDKYGETIAPGSSIQIEKSSINVDSNGVYHFTTWNLPDRGMNVDGTVNTFARIHKFNVDFTPANSSSTDNIIWTYEDTILLTDFNGDYMSGLDSNTTINFNNLQVPAVVYHGDGWGNNLNSSTTTTRISLDSESLTFIDGSINNGFWISDEYGPSLIKFDSNGKMTDYIEAPGALLPHVNGDLFFSSDDNYYFDQSYSVTENQNGRYSNHGYEGMDISPDGKYLFTLLQSATVQDGGEKSKSRFNSRLLKYDLSSETPELVGEYVVVLPTYSTSKVKTAAQSEMRIINENLILVLARDAHLGRGGEDGTTAIFKHVDFWSLTDATNIVGKYDDVGAQIATSKGVLNSDITPATHYSFIDLLDSTELAKFGLHNGDPDNDHLLNEKWEGMDLLPVKCTTDEYFLLLSSDSDYKTTNGFMDFGKITYNSGIDVDTQNLIYHIKLPSLPHDSSCSSSSSVISSSKISSKSLSSSSSISLRPYVTSSVSSSISSLVSSKIPSSSSSSSSSVPSSVSSLASSLSSKLSSSSISSTVLPTSSSSDIVSSVTASSKLVPSYTTYTTVIDGITSTVIVPCSTTSLPSSISSETSTILPTSYTSYTTVIDGVTSTVIVPCSTSGSEIESTKQLTSTSKTENETSKSVAPTSYSTVTTVTNGSTVTIVVPCSTTQTESSNKSSSSVTEAESTTTKENEVTNTSEFTSKFTSTTSALLSSSSSNNAEESKTVTSVYEGFGNQFTVNNGLVPIVAAILAVLV